MVESNSRAAVSAASSASEEVTASSAAQPATPGHGAAGAGFRANSCFKLSRKLIEPPEAKTADFGAYVDWRNESLARSWSAFPDEAVRGKDVLDFGCGNGPLSLFLATRKSPRRLIGVDLYPEAIRRARAAAAITSLPAGVELQFVEGKVEGLPVADRSFDTLVAFDCMEHVMAPAAILRDWFRVLRPGGTCLLEWFPFKGPWGPHMEALIPIPWAHVIFGERAMFRAAEMIYDLPEFVPRHWDLDENGQKKPNKWRAWSTFREQGYVNELGIAQFRNLACAAGFEIVSMKLHGLGGSSLRRSVGRVLMGLPLVGEYFVSYVTIELRKPAA